MAFVLKQSSDTYNWPVAFEIPNEGKYESYEFQAEFLRIPQSRIEEMMEMLQTEELRVAREIVPEFLVGWDGVEDDNGKPIKYTKASLGRLLEVPMLAIAIAQAFFESNAGAKRKN